MNTVEDVENECTVLKNFNFYVDLQKDAEIYKQILSDLRLLLVKNLGLAIVCK